MNDLLRKLSFFNCYSNSLILAVFSIILSTPWISSSAQEPTLDLEAISIPIGQQDQNLKPLNLPPAANLILEGAQLSLIENVRLSTRDPGILESVDVREGQRILSGDIIATLDREMHAAEKNAAHSELEIAKHETENDVDLKYAKVSADVNEKVLNRSRQAVAQFKKSISKTEIERLNLELQRSVFAQQQAQRKLDMNRLAQTLKQEQLTIADLRLQNREIKSPIDGTVVQLYRQPGEWINTGEPIARIVNLKKLRVRCLGDAELRQQLKIGNAATFKTAAGETAIEIPAKIVFLSPEIDPVEQDFAIWAEVDNADGSLKPGMVGVLVIQTAP